MISDAPALAPTLDVRSQHPGRLRRGGGNEEAFASLLGDKSADGTSASPDIIPNGLAPGLGEKAPPAAPRVEDGQDDAEASLAGAPEGRARKRLQNAPVSSIWKPLVFSAALPVPSSSEQTSHAAAGAGPEGVSNQSEGQLDDLKQNPTLAEGAPGAFVLLGMQTYFAPQATQSGKFAQALKRTEMEANGVTGTRADDAPAAAIEKEEAEAADTMRASMASHKTPAGKTGADAGGPGHGEQPLAAQMAEAAADAGQSAGQAAATPVQQIFEAIEAAAPEATLVQNAPLEDQTASYQPLRSIKLALEPSSLGTVAIELSLSGGELGVKIEASEGSTAQLLRQQDSGLRELLQSAGYTVGLFSVQATTQLPLLSLQAGPQAEGFSGTQGGDGGASAQAEDGAAAGKRQGRKDSGDGRSEGNPRDRSLFV